MSDKAVSDIFWMIWCEGNRAPTKVHMTYESVISEAKRLAESNPGKVFYITESVGYAVAQRPTAQFTMKGFVYNER